MAVLAVLSTGPDAPAAGSGPGGGRPALDPLDLALVRGEAVFEALRTYGGRPFRLEAHLERLPPRPGRSSCRSPAGWRTWPPARSTPPAAATSSSGSSAPRARREPR